MYCVWTYCRDIQKHTHTYRFCPALFLYTKLFCPLQSDFWIVIDLLSVCSSLGCCSLTLPQRQQPLQVSEPESAQKSAVIMWRILAAAADSAGLTAARIHCPDPVQHP